MDGRDIHKRKGCISYVGHGESLPGMNTAGAVVGQTILLLLSNRFVCQAIEPTVLTEGVDFVVLNLMSDYPGMRWDIGPIERTIFSCPQASPARPWTPRYGTPSTVQAAFHRRPASINSVFFTSQTGRGSRVSFPGGMSGNVALMSLWLVSGPHHTASAVINESKMT